MHTSADGTKAAKKIKLIVLLIAFASPFASSMYLPALPTLGKQLGSTDAALLAFTFSIFLLGFGFSQLVYGPLSDAFGRRKIIMIGTLITIIGSLGCMWANNIEGFIFFRLVQGCGIGAGSALTRSMLRDCFEGKALNMAVSQVGAIFAIAPMLSPMIGGYIYHWFGWRCIFLFSVIYLTLNLALLVFWYQESNPHLNIKAIWPRHIWQNYMHLLTDRTFMGYLLCASFSYGGINAYITISPFLLQQELGVSAVQTAWITCTIVSGLVIGRSFNNYLFDRFDTAKIMQAGMLIMLLSGILLLIPSLWGIMNVSVIMIPVLLYVIGTGFVMPNSFAGSLAPFGNMAGAAGALYGSLSLLISFIISGITALLREHSQMPLAMTYIILALATLIIFQFLLPKTTATVEV